MMLREETGLLEVQARHLASRIEQETVGQVQVTDAYLPPRGKFWRLRLLLRGWELVYTVANEEDWRSIRAAWNELVPGLVPACRHRWVRLPRSVGLFHCLGCGERAVCPGCLDSVMVALVAADAGFTVVWCKTHNMPVEEAS